MGNQTREKMENFRGFGGVQSYPSRTKDIDDVDFSTGSVGLGVAITSFASIIQDYIRVKSWGSDAPMGRMVALVGDAELDEGNVYEAVAGRLEERPAKHVVDHRLQPTVTGRYRPGRAVRTDRENLRCVQLGCLACQIWGSATRGL